MGIFTSKWIDIICKCGRPAKSYDMWCNCLCHEPEREKGRQRQENRYTPYYGDIKESRRIITKITNELKK